MDSFTSLTAIHKLKKKVLEPVFFRKTLDHSNNIFAKHKILTIFELHVRELLKLVLEFLSKYALRGFFKQSLKIASDREKHADFCQMPNS